jgi:imidazolonepropionase
MLDVGLIHDGAVAVHEGRILAAGDSDGLRERYRGRENIDASGKVVCPGFVDPHTHVIYAGDRVDEFELRVQGATYMEIMAAGGGIASTMAATRQASLTDLVVQSRPRLEAMLALGTTTIEIKTGYGLTIEDELKMLAAIELLAEEVAADLVPTFLAAHAVPPEYEDHSEAYVDLWSRRCCPRPRPGIVNHASPAGARPFSTTSSASRTPLI